MSSCSRLRTFLWRRLFLQTIRRHYLSLLAEIVFVLVVFAFILGNDRVNLACVKKINASYAEDVTREAFDMVNARRQLAVVYGPSNDRTDKLVKRLLDWIKGDVIVEGYEYSKERQGYDQTGSETSIDSPSYHGPIPLEDAGSVVTGCRSRIIKYINNDPNSYYDAASHTMCIEFAADSTHEVSTGSLTYNIVLPVPPDFTFPQGVLYSMHEIVKKSEILSTTNDMSVVGGFIFVSLTAIDYTHMLLQGNFKNSTKLYITTIPARTPVLDIDRYRVGFFVATTVGFCLPLLWRIRAVTMEIESGLKDLQEVMGLPSSLFWLGHFLSAWAISVLDSAFAIFVTMVPKAQPEPASQTKETEPSNEYVQVYKSSFNRTTYLRNADLSLVIASFAAFSNCHTLLALLIACAFPLGRWAMVIAFGTYFLLPLTDGEKLSYLLGSNLWAYLTKTKAEKLRTAFYPNVAFARIIKIIGIFDDFEGSAGWDITGKYAVKMDSVTINEMFFILFTTTFILAVMIAYISNVSPWTTTRPQPLLFPVMPSYWFPDQMVVVAVGVNETDNAERFEAAPSLDPIIECKNLVKVYGGSAVLKNVSMTIYKSQVTILLGHNGAGKTTLMSILTGLVEPNSGLVLVSGQDIRTAGFERMGFCPQFDAFFTDLTVSEQLTYFGAIRGLEISSLPKIIENLLHSVRLSEKAHAFPHELSGGMKRRLSIALALLTSPEVLILDEPTAGLDPETRRTIWSLINELRGKASILLSTHDMEEADVLADRIIVMYSGSVVCWGSPSFLKNACGRTAVDIGKVQLMPQMLQRFRALIQKRLLYLWRTPFLFVIGWILPVVMAWIGLTVFNLNHVELPPDFSHFNLSTILSEGAEEQPAKVFIEEVTPNDNSLRYKVLLESQNVPYEVFTDTKNTLLAKYNENFFQYMLNYAFGSIFNTTEIEMWMNPTSVIASSIEGNLIDTMLLRQQTTHPNARFDTGVSIVRLTEQEVPPPQEDIPNKGSLNELARVMAYTWFYWGVMMPVSIGLITSTFVVLPSLEICNGARALQLMTGVSGLLYLGTNFIFDLLFYLVPVATIYTGFAVIHGLSGNTSGALALLMLCSAPLNIFLPYLISELTTDGGAAYAVNMGLFMIAGPGVVFGYLFASQAAEGQNVRLPFFLFPPFDLPAASVRAINIETELAACHYLQSRKKLAIEHTQFCDDTQMYGSTLKFCCDVLRKKTKEPWYEVQAVSTSPHGILYDILFMLVFGGVMFLYLLYRVSGGCSLDQQSTLPPGKAAMSEDEDVAAEWIAVERICENRSFGESTLVARRLHKTFGELQAVKELSFALRPAECFGLLGVNGAGKSTTFRMLTGLTNMTYGEAFMRDAVLSKDPRKWQSRIGYCPQINALLGKLTAYENLYLFGRLRGLPEESLPDAVERIIEIADLREHAAKKCDYYSGGNMRKLSVGVALVGLPEVVFLDEPYAGVDVLARARIDKRLSRIKNSTQCSIVLTSHSMEECEVACDRMCIMVQGTMLCLGTLQHLKDKFGKGCRIQFLLPDSTVIAPQELIKKVGSAFPGLKVLNTNAQLLEIRIEAKLPWSTMFQKIASLEKDITFEHVLVSDNTLEQLFIEFAQKGQQGTNVNISSDQPSAV
ncbi:phospholipid-transporting ATPase ABCA3-like isoform X2 [Dermacentor albipictus]|uniref:phospholipid-transporting ATPase ABCA3-like isoform X2 n=1 Tax=Dermacentor albipictus TaxID=60249 RepID=UPI0038FD2AC0